MVTRLIQPFICFLFLTKSKYANAPSNIELPEYGTTSAIVSETSSATSTTSATSCHLI